MRAREAQASSSQSSPAVSAVDTGHLQASRQGSGLQLRCPHRWYELCFRKTTGTPDSQTTERERVTFCSHLVTARNYSYSFAPSAASIPPPPPIAIALSCCIIAFAANMLSSTSRTALRRAANNKFTVKAGVRAVSAWSSVPQGPPVSQLLVLLWWPGSANVLAGCK